MVEYRAVVDVRIAFVNGGGLRAEGFRLDLPGPDLGEAEVARLLVQHLGLAMVGEVVFDAFAIVEERHKGSRGMAPATAPAAAAPTQLVDLPTEVFHLEDATERGIPAAVFTDRDVRGKAVLLHTGWDRHFGAPEYGRPAPFLTAAGTDYLVSQGVVLVGIDSLNIDDTSADAAGERPAHSAFLANDIHVVEHLTRLGELPPSGALFTAVPPKFEGTGTFTVRAYAKVPA